MWYKLEEKNAESGIATSLEDIRCPGRQIKTEFIGQLRDNQKKAMQELLKFDNGILNAATAFGKTVVCCAIIAEKKVNTLIILESSSLIEQWEKALNSFLCIDEALPEYHTKTGRIKK